ncbi:NAD-dependent malic enzyme [Streptacidiphilus sp. P02-A3a]|uniref:NAD-dependent malic enzyme n=1 Tax=Streptacidiphilus sp. P02-A3a TaxID=2704468 RepID=UPI0015FD950E|nr:NAD-dependent malic enzyme [Streptacidiphilus sp. P02-A3a]QMU70224.1 NAD-dependent malic enzyme [Streptacidiphilus sp. P02-A3a]QMU70320.1 NAD-dependent malic enzyme [Streptacidiphilus sp. P02-A3a]
MGAKTGDTTLRGVRLLESPLDNRGTAFTVAQRREFGLVGLLPPVVETLQEQVDRAYDAFLAYDKPINRHIYLRQLQDMNEVLFYRLVTEHLEEMLPVVYTPTVGEACQRFSEIYRRPRGLFVSYPDRDRLREVIANRPNREVDVIVVTDGQRILGLGDQGAGGMGIPIGKLGLYTAVGGIHPARTLPILLDVGTDNEELLADPRYLGWRERRVTGKEYDEFVDRFVEAVRAELPDVLLQWEDFATPHARPILARYRDQLLTFNDDIQGTAAVVVGALASAAAVTGRSLREQRVVMLGAGSAAIGVADTIRAAMVAEGATDEQAGQNFWVIDVHGLLVESRDDLSPEQRRYARDGKPFSLEELVERISADVLIGLSTVGGAFTESVVRTMASKVDRPVIFPLSNPTSHSEADPADLAEWTGGRALIATGSPYPPLEIDGRRVPVAQSNNVYIFPAMGLAVTAARATRVTDNMLVAAAKALGTAAAGHGASGTLLPPVGTMREVAHEVALAAALAAVADGVAPAADEDELRAALRANQWQPAYPD